MSDEQHTETATPAPVADGTPNEGASEQPAAKPEGGQSAETKPANEQPANSEATPEDWKARYETDEKRWKGSQAGYTRKLNEQQQLLSVMQAKIAELESAKPEPKAQPEDLRTKLDLYETFKAQVAKAKDPEEKARIADLWSDRFTDADIEAIREVERKDSELRRSLALGDTSLLEGVVSKKAEEIVRQKEAELNAAREREAQYAKHVELFKQPGVLDKIAARQQDFMDGLGRGLTAQEILDSWKKDDEIATLKGQLAKVAAKTVQGDEQSRLAKAVDTARRDPVVASKVTPNQIYAKAVERAKELGVPTNGKAFQNLLSKTIEQMRKG